MKRFLILLTSLAIAACSHTQTKPGYASYTQASSKFAEHKGDKVSWLGRILSIHTLSNKTVVELMAMKSRHTNADSNDLGRFVAEFAEFKDPDQYAKGRIMTVQGTLTRQQRKKIGSYPYTYPVVAVTNHTLWRKYDPHYDDYPRWRWGIGWRSGGRGSIGIGWGW